MMKIQSFDIDGVIFLGIEDNAWRIGARPGPHDVIITGRSLDESPETLDMLRSVGIMNPVYFNTARYHDKSRTTSGQHKAKTINMLAQQGLQITRHWEDDDIQAAEIAAACPGVTIIHVVHDLVDKENARQPVLDA